MAAANFSLFTLHFYLNISPSLYPCNRVALADVLAGLHADVHELAAHSSWDSHDFAPLRLQVAEGVALLIGLSDERFYAGCHDAFAAEAPQELSS